MRLTLRTLLAYLDEMLESSQTEELSHKIRESDFASGLVHRIRNSMGRLRVSCPQVLGTGLTNDANTVAQYLDNQLPSDRVSDFEKICLESDMHLAEVASCHQILALVLGERAQVSEPLRARIYAIPHKYRSMSLGPPPAAPPVGEVLQSAEDGHGPHLQPASSERNVWREDPDGGNNQAYAEDRGVAQQRRRSTLWIPATLVIFVLGVATVYLLSDRFFAKPIASREGADRPNPGDLAPPQDPGQFNPPSFSNSSNGATNGAQRDGQADTSSAESIYQSPPQELQRNLTPAATDPVQRDVGPPVATDSHATSEFPLTSSGMDQLGTPAAVDLPSNFESASTVDVPVGAPDSAAEVTAPATELNGTGGSDESMRDTSGPAIDQDHPDRLPPDGTEPVVTPASQDFGRFLLAEVSAFTYGDQWMRADVREPLGAGMRIRVPVAFHPPMLVLGNSVNITLGGRSELEVLDFLRGSIPHFRMPFGKAIVSIAGGDTRRVAVSVGNRIHFVAFDDLNGEFALEVTPDFRRGDDALSESRQHRVRLWPSKGRIVISENGRPVPEVFVAERQSVMIVGNEDAVLVEKDELPLWVDKNRLDAVEKQSLYRLEPMLDANRPLPIALAEVAESKKADLKSLAIRGLASFDRFDPMVGSLDDVRMHAFWKSHVLELQAAMARGPDSARKILDSLQARFGPESSSIHRMLMGYSPEQLEEYGAIDLVEALSHEELPYRVVALNTLLQITGKTHLYNPKDSAAKRKPYLAEWRNRLRRGQIRYASAQIEPLGIDL